MHLFLIALQTRLTAAAVEPARYGAAAVDAAVSLLSANVRPTKSFTRTRLPCIPTYPCPCIHVNAAVQPTDAVFSPGWTHAYLETRGAKGVVVDGGFYKVFECDKAACPMFSVSPAFLFQRQYAHVHAAWFIWGALDVLYVVALVDLVAASCASV